MHLQAILIITSLFTPRSAHLLLVPSRFKFNPAIGQIYPHATFTPSWCIRGISFFKFTPRTIPLGFVQTSVWCLRMHRLVHTAPDVLTDIPANEIN